MRNELKNDGREISYHITSRLGAAGVQKGRFWRPEIKFSSKVAKFTEYIGIDLTLKRKIDIVAETQLARSTR